MVAIPKATRSRVFPAISYYLDYGTTPLKGGCRATNMSLLKSWHSIISVAFKAITKRSSTKSKSLCTHLYSFLEWNALWRSSLDGEKVSTVIFHNLMQ